MKRWAPAIIAVTAALITLAFLTASRQSVAQMACGPHDSIVAALAKSYGERPVALGISGGGQATVEIFLNPTTRTFSIIRRIPTQGVACLVADGENFEPLPIEDDDQQPDNPT